ncbi:MAG: phosphoribosylanthranilate isomerase [SAR86 cluster bacterium]|uniref:N-(5'-phosphoribosyl)anthranilate isomerase n=1 Tax=SAR86 cluster bacterium TaxID=2030880 RepID=A0A520MXK6_9GAMM|nr:MAG: phosphoribosylanthranilate isomerase [SAR86 cluster bacterium]|tara:strand:- start:2242 stop:2853 length:612 start_codon:yes stop_codon:yes gene_type:complete
MKPLIKICGINDIDILDELVMIDGITFLGFIFYDKSPRNVTNNFLEKINKFDFKDKKPVCVYVNADRDFINETSSNFRNPILQFHGDESNDFCSDFNKDFWKVIKVKDNESIKDYVNYPNASKILFENYKKGQHGGTGSSFNWDLINNIKDLDTKFILSGGINIKNVDNAIDIKPWCLDVNSGVESSPGKKDIRLIQNLLNKI